METQEDVHRMNDAMRHHWNAAVCEELGVNNRYTRIAVLLIHWDIQYDEELKCSTETAELSEVFSQLYGFSTQTATLRCDVRKPEQQLLRDVSAFVYEHDGDYRNTLLVLYYSGHGYMQSKKFFISGVRDPSRIGIGGEPGHDPLADWQPVEDCLKTAHADVLTIMDCCYAAGVMKDGGHHTRTFETLAATDVVTPQPGPLSYTRALIDELKEQSENHKGKAMRTFDTIFLHDRIRKRLDSAAPRLLNRLKSAIARHIHLAPLKTPSEPGEAEPARVKRNRGSLQIQIDFAKHSSLSREETIKLARRMTRTAIDADLHVTDLKWGVFVPKPYVLQADVRSTFRLTALLQRAMIRRAVRLSIRDGSAGRAQRPRKRKRMDRDSQAHLALTPPSSVRGTTPGS